MQRKRDSLIPIGEVFDGLGGPVKAIRDASPQARHHFTQADQVDHSLSGPAKRTRISVSWPADGAVLPAAHQSRRPERVQARQRAVHALHDRYKPLSLVLSFPGLGSIDSPFQIQVSVFGESCPRPLSFRLRSDQNLQKRSYATGDDGLSAARLRT